MSKAILYDSTLCIGCKACEGGCAERWGLPYNDKIAAEETISAHKLTAVQTHGERYSRRLVHELPTTGVRVGVPGGRVAEDRAGTGGLRRGEMHGLPLLHAGLPVPGALLRMGQAPAEDAQVRHVLRAAEPGQADGVRGSLSGGRHDVRRPRRTAGGSAYSGWPRSPASTTTRSTECRKWAAPACCTFRRCRSNRSACARMCRRKRLPETTWRVLELVPDVVSTGTVMLGGIWWITNRRAEVAKKEGRRK